MHLTVAICTYNRASLLRQTLEEMTLLNVPRGVTWELLIVNNNCTDATDAVVSEFVGRLPVRRLHEPTPGQSAARNCAVAASSGDYIVWTDDDVLVDQDWLRAYARAFERWPDAVAFGGRIEPWFEGTPPSWLVEVLPQVASAFATVDLGPEPGLLAWPDRMPFGANMAFRTAEQRSFTYDIALGLKPGGQVRGEETMLLRRLLDGGAVGRWVPDARVRHFIPKSRQSWSYLRGFFDGYGQVLARTEPDFHSARLFGRPRWLWREVVTRSAAYRVRRLTSAPQDWIDQFKAVHTYWGYFRTHPRAPRHVR